MFKPVPHYPQSEYEKDADEIPGTKDLYDLYDFIKDVEEYAQKYQIDLSNRFSAILTTCKTLRNLLDKEGKKIWPKNCKEPLNAFQNMFQILIYALSDSGLLFDEYGSWCDYWDFSPGNKLYSRSLSST